MITHTSVKKIFYFTPLLYTKLDEWIFCSLFSYSHYNAFNRGTILFALGISVYTI